MQYKVVTENPRQLRIVTADRIEDKGTYIVFKQGLFRKTVAMYFSPYSVEVYPTEKLTRGELVELGLVDTGAQ